MVVLLVAKLVIARDYDPNLYAETKMSLVLKKSRKRKVYRTNIVIRGFFYVFLYVFAWKHNIKRRIPKEIKDLKPPYLVLGNHVGFWDPFVAGNFLPHYVHFVSSDVAFHNPIFSFFLTRLGTIPKKKNVRDSKVIRDIAAVIGQGENIGIYPEAVRNWAGTSFPIDPSIAKLIKMLKVPVVVPKIRGMNLFNPRWSTELRKTRVYIDYSIALSKDDVQMLSLDDIYEKLCNAIQHDEVDYQREAMIPVKSKKLAEHISYAIYVCPECHEIDTFLCRGNHFHCEACSYDIEIDSYVFFKRPKGGKLYFDNIRDWYYWEEKFLNDLVIQKLRKESSDPILVDKNSKVFHRADGVKMEEIGTADVSLFTDRIEIAYHEREKFNMNFDDLQTINPQVKENIEIIYNGEAYRIVGYREGISALKWEVAVNAIWREAGQKSKLSPYIKP